MDQPELVLLEGANFNLRRHMNPASAGLSNPGFHEIREACFRRNGRDWSLLVDDAPLPCGRRGGQDVWLWKPGFYAGTVRAELIRGNERRGIEYLLDVAPDPEKVGQDAFLGMVESVWEFDPYLVVGDESATTAVGEHGVKESLAICYHRLASGADALIASAAAITREPHRTLRGGRRHVPLHGVRRADVQTALAAMTSDNAAVFTGDDETAGTAKSGHQSLFSVPISEETFDSTANRTMAALMMLVLQTIERVYRQLEGQAQRESEGEGIGLAARWPRRQRLLDELRFELKKVLEKVPFNAVLRREITPAGLTAIATRPVYARTQQLIWKMIRPGYELGEKADWSSMSPTWSLYESWCYVELSRYLRGKFPEWIWSSKSTAEGRYCLIGRQGTKHISLHLQQIFSYAPAVPASGFWSVSTQLIPDIVLVLGDGDRSSWAVMDAKYRRGRNNVLNAMRSAHVYRDALRRHSSGPAWSLLLLPAYPDDAGWILERDFHYAHGVGAIVMSPECAEFDAIETFLDEFFRWDFIG